MTANASLAAPAAVSYNSNSATIEPQEVEEAAEDTSLTAEEMIRAYAEDYGVKEASMRATISCESAFRHDGVYGDGGLAYGIAQFHENTFNDFKKRAGMPELDYRLQEDQIKLMAWAFANDNAYHWSCWRKYKTKQLAISRRIDNIDKHTY